MLIATLRSKRVKCIPESVAHEFASMRFKIVGEFGRQQERTRTSHLNAIDLSINCSAVGHQDVGGSAFRSFILDGVLAKSYS